MGRVRGAPHMAGEALTDIVIWLFAACNGLRIVAYLAQIIRLADDRSGAEAVSYVTWLMFALANGSTVAYALVVVEDWRMAAIFMFNVLCCLTILVLATIRRAQHRAGMALR